MLLINMTYNLVPESPTLNTPADYNNLHSHAIRSIASLEKESPTKNGDVIYNFQEDTAPNPITNYLMVPLPGDSKEKVMRTYETVLMWQPEKADEIKDMEALSQATSRLIISGIAEDTTSGCTATTERIMSAGPSHYIVYGYTDAHCINMFPSGVVNFNVNGVHVPGSIVPIALTEEKTLKGEASFLDLRGFVYIAPKSLIDEGTIRAVRHLHDLNDEEIQRLRSEDRKFYISGFPVIVNPDLISDQNNLTLPITSTVNTGLPGENNQLKVKELSGINIISGDDMHGASGGALGYVDKDGPVVFALNKGGWGVGDNSSSMVSTVLPAYEYLWGYLQNQEPEKGSHYSKVVKSPNWDNELLNPRDTLTGVENIHQAGAYLLYHTNIPIDVITGQFFMLQNTIDRLGKFKSMEFGVNNNLVIEIEDADGNIRKVVWDPVTSRGMIL